MRKILISALSAVAAMTFSVGALAQVVGSNHDMTANYTVNLSGGFNTDGRVCIYCHVPHHARNDATTPLWNRDDSVADFTMYDANYSSSMDMIVAAAPQGVSAACLSCHDGTIAVDNLYNQPWVPGGSWTSDGTNLIPTHFKVGPDLTTDHPISVTYDEAQDDEFIPLASVNADLPFFSGAENQLECGTCHDVHYQGFAAGESLRVDNAGSDLCLACHIK